MSTKASSPKLSNIIHIKFPRLMQKYHQTFVIHPYK